MGSCFNQPPNYFYLILDFEFINKLDKFNAYLKILMHLFNKIAIISKRFSAFPSLNLRIYSKAVFMQRLPQFLAAIACAVPIAVPENL